MFQYAIFHLHPLNWELNYIFADRTYGQWFHLSVLPRQFTDVGELIGIVSLEKIGLANKNNVRFELSKRPEADGWFHLAMCNGGKIELILAASLVSAPGYLYYISLVSHKSAGSLYGKVYSFGSQSVDFKLYSKKEENVIHYYLNITRNWLSLSFLPIFIGDNATILAENANIPNLEELTEIPVESSIV